MQNPLKKLYFHIKEAKLLIKSLASCFLPSVILERSDRILLHERFKRFYRSTPFHSRMTGISLSSRGADRRSDLTPRPRLPHSLPFVRNDRGFINLKPLLGVFFIFTILSLSIYFALSDDGNKTFKEGRQYTVVNEKEIVNIPDNDFIKELPEYKKAFKDMSISFVSTEAIASDKIEKTRTIEKKGENKIISSNFSLEGINITSEYKEENNTSQSNLNTPHPNGHPSQRGELDEDNKNSPLERGTAERGGVLDNEIDNQSAKSSFGAADETLPRVSKTKQAIKVKNITDKDQVITFSN